MLTQVTHFEDRPAPLDFQLVAVTNYAVEPREKKDASSTSPQIETYGTHFLCSDVLAVQQEKNMIGLTRPQSNNT